MVIAEKLNQIPHSCVIHNIYAKYQINLHKCIYSHSIEFIHHLLIMLVQIVCNI